MSTNVTHYGTNPVATRPGTTPAAFLQTAALLSVIGNANPAPSQVAKAQDIASRTEKEEFRAAKASGRTGGLFQGTSGGRGSNPRSQKAQARLERALAARREATRFQKPSPEAQAKAAKQDAEQLRQAQTPVATRPRRDAPTTPPTGITPGANATALGAPQPAAPSRNNPNPVAAALGDGHLVVATTVGATPQVVQMAATVDAGQVHPQVAQAAFAPANRTETNPAVEVVAGGKLAITAAQYTPGYSGRELEVTVCKIHPTTGQCTPVATADPANAETSGSQDGPQFSVVKDASSQRVLLVYESNRGGVASDDIVGQALTFNGTHLEKGPAVRVNEKVEGVQEKPYTAPVPGDEGLSVVTWRDYSAAPGSANGTFSGRLVLANANGTVSPVGPEVPLSGHVVSGTLTADVAAFSPTQATYVIQELDGLYIKEGAISAETGLAAPEAGFRLAAGNVTQISNPKITHFERGYGAVTWTENGKIMAKMITPGANGTSVYSETFQVSETMTGNDHPQVEYGGKGEFVIVFAHTEGAEQTILAKPYTVNALVPSEKPASSSKKGLAATVLGGIISAGVVALMLLTWAITAAIRRCRAAAENVRVRVERVVHDSFSGFEHPNPVYEPTPESNPSVPSIPLRTQSPIYEEVDREGPDALLTPFVLVRTAPGHLQVRAANPEDTTQQAYRRAPNGALVQASEYEPYVRANSPEGYAVVAPLALRRNYDKTGVAPYAVVTPDGETQLFKVRDGQLTQLSPSEVQALQEELYATPSTEQTALYDARRKAKSSEYATPQDQIPVPGHLMRTPGGNYVPFVLGPKPPRPPEGEYDKPQERRRTKVRPSDQATYYTVSKASPRPSEETLYASLENPDDGYLETEATPIVLSSLDQLVPPPTDTNL